MRKIGSITCNWNGARFIVPHLEMIVSGVDRAIVLQGDSPWADYVEEHGISSEPDNSEQLIRDNFPNVEIYSAVQNKYGADLYNQGLGILSDCDIVLRLDFDMFMTQKDWRMFIKIIQDTDYDCYRLNFMKRTINYYFDCNHGVRDAREFDSVAVSPKGRFRGILDYIYGRGYCIENEDFIIHHFKGWKGYGANKDWIKGKTENRWGVKAPEMPLYFNEADGGKWLVAPKEIRNKLCQSQ